MEIIEMELIVPSLRRVFLKDCVKELIRDLSGLNESSNLQILYWIITISLENSLNEHWVGPSLNLAIQNWYASNLETSIQFLLIIFVKYYKTCTVSYVRVRMSQHNKLKKEQVLPKSLSTNGYFSKRMPSISSSSLYTASPSLSSFILTVNLWPSCVKLYGS